jgi:hypothetical protein
MSRSRRHTPIAGNAGNKSEKSFKQRSHGQYRARERALMSAEADPVEFPVKMRDVTNPWEGPKDGKSFFAGMLKRDDPDGFWARYYEKSMRK